MIADAGWVRDGDAPHPSRVCIGDLLFDNLDLAQSAATVERALASGRRGYVVTPNVDHLVLYRDCPAFRAACRGAALRLADGMPIVWASRLMGQPLRARAAGSDLFPVLCEMAAARRYTVFLLGGAAGVADQAAIRLAARFPGIRIAGVYAPPDRFEHKGEAAEVAVLDAADARAWADARAAASPPS